MASRISNKGEKETSQTHSQEGTGMVCMRNQNTEASHVGR